MNVAFEFTRYLAWPPPVILFNLVSAIQLFSFSFFLQWSKHILKITTLFTSFSLSLWVIYYRLFHLGLNALDLPFSYDQ